VVVGWEEEGVGWEEVVVEGKEEEGWVEVEVVGGEVVTRVGEEVSGSSWRGSLPGRARPRWGRSAGRTWRMHSGRHGQSPAWQWSPSRWSCEYTGDCP
jgi:hypothetical protein